MNQSTPASPAPSLASRAIAAVTRRRHGGQCPELTGTAITPLGTLDALELLCERLGKSATRTHLTAALPVAEGELAPRFMPHALSRVGLEAHWGERTMASLLPEDLPVLALLRDGGALLVLALGADGTAVIRDGAGQCTVPCAMIQPLLSGEVLHSGHLDPENGASEERDKALVRRNPKLWLLGAYLGERAAIGRMVLAATLLNLCAFTIPLYMRAIYDRVVPNGLHQRLDRLEVTGGQDRDALARLMSRAASQQAALDVLAARLELATDGADPGLSGARAGLEMLRRRLDARLDEQSGLTPPPAVAPADLAGRFGTTD